MMIKLDKIDTPDGQNAELDKASAAIEACVRALQEEIGGTIVMIRIDQEGCLVAQSMIGEVVPEEIFRKIMEHCIDDLAKKARIFTIEPMGNA